MADILNTLSKAKNTCNGKPICVLAHTVKGKGVSFMEHSLTGIESPDPRTVRESDRRTERSRVMHFNAAKSPTRKVFAERHTLARRPTRTSWSLNRPAKSTYLRLSSTTRSTLRVISTWGRRKSARWPPPPAWPPKGATSSSAAMAFITMRAIEAIRSPVCYLHLNVKFLFRVTVV